MTTNKSEVLGYFPEFSSVIEDGKFTLLLSHFTTRADAYEMFGDECRMVPVIRLTDYEALQAECESLKVAAKYSEAVDATPENQRETILYDTLRERDALQAECEKLRAAIRRLCDIYLVDDYYSGDLREELLDRAVERSIEKTVQGGGNAGS